MIVEEMIKRAKRVFPDHGESKKIEPHANQDSNNTCKSQGYKPLNFEIIRKKSW